jgi:hypothetical protein
LNGKAAAPVWKTELTAVGIFFLIVGKNYYKYKKGLGSEQEPVVSSCNEYSESLKARKLLNQLLLLKFELTK